MNDFTINDLGLYKDYSYLNELIEYALDYLQVKNAILSIIFVDEKTIREINRDYRQQDRVTDVISFAFEDNENIVYNDMCRPLGEIYICIPRMIEQAKEYGHSEKRELSFLTIHGLLHLLGYDHMNAKQEKEMFELQELILDDKDITR